MAGCSGSGDWPEPVVGKAAFRPSKEMLPPCGPRPRAATTEGGSSCGSCGALWPCWPEASSLLAKSAFSWSAAGSLVASSNFCAWSWPPALRAATGSRRPRRRRCRCPCPGACPGACRAGRPRSGRQHHAVLDRLLSLGLGGLHAGRHLADGLDHGLGPSVTALPAWSASLPAWSMTLPVSWRPRRRSCR